MLTGRKIGGFEVRDLLGTGGMASVYKGYDPALDREVAIKVIGTAGESPDFVARFQREARVVAKLRHPNIVQIYQFGEEKDIVYMVQELLTGATLQRKMRDARRRMAPDRIHATISQLASALDFAHSQGVIHRDVKPSNVIANTSGQLVLTDFGIARTESDAKRTMTGPGVVMGTPAYLAPEQAVGSASLTLACDVYALGVVLFELLTGRLPFEDTTPMGIILKHLYDDPPKPSSIRPDLPKAVDALVLRALEKEPKKRHPSAGALAKALGDAWPAVRNTKQEEQPAPRPRAAPKRSDTTPPRRVTPAAGSAAAPAPAAAPRASGTAAKSTPSVVVSTSAPATAPKQRAKSTTPKPTPAKAAQSQPSRATPPATPQRRGPSTLLVGLLTLIVVLGLLIYGFYPSAFQDVVTTVQGLARP